MDLRTGQTYATREEALAAGVPDSDIAEIVGDPADPHPAAGEIVRFSSGPFKNRVYRRMANGQLTRIDKDAGRGVYKYDEKGVLRRVRV